MEVENLKQEIIGQSRHQFIYGYNTADREKQIKEMVSGSSITTNENQPMSIYLSDVEVKTSSYNTKTDKWLASSLNREYLSFLIAYTLLDKTLLTNDFNNFPERVTTFLNAINRLVVTSEKKDIESLQELLKTLKIGLEFYKINYQSVMETGTFVGNVAELPISFLYLPTFITYFKKLINNNSYVAVLIDVQEPISNIVAQSINDYLSKRCNGDISMKIVCEPGLWPIYYDSSGNIVEYIHDYGIVELDDSHFECIKRIKERFTSDYN